MVHIDKLIGALPIIGVSLRYELVCYIYNSDSKGMKHQEHELDSHINSESRQKFSEGGSFDTAGVFGAAQGSQKPLGIWCKILQSSNFQTLHSNFRKALFSITNF